MERATTLREERCSGWSEGENGNYEGDEGEDGGKGDEENGQRKCMPQSGEYWPLRRTYRRGGAGMKTSTSKV
ncbi:hypothetical protein P8452_66438 [Trifolium repens]|nr:hypothetical protein P8452_66438 [Trifolium repens]